MDLLLKSFARLRCTNYHLKTLRPFSSVHNTSASMTRSGATLCETKTLRASLFQNNHTWTTIHGMRNRCGFHTVSNSMYFNTVKNDYEGMKQPILPSLLNQISHPTKTTTRNVTVISRNKGKRKSANVILKRFRRLGNGLWIRRQSKYKKKIWLKLLMGKGPKRVYKCRRHLILNKWQSDMLDKMVTSCWKTQKWYVKDPYQGYTKETLFHYHPKDLPWNSTKLPDDYYKYAVRRFNRGNLMRKNRRQKHKAYAPAYRQKQLPLKPQGFMFA